MSNKEEETGNKPGSPRKEETEIRINKESLPNCDGCCGGCNWSEHD